METGALLCFGHGLMCHGRSDHALYGLAVSGLVVLSPPSAYPVVWLSLLSSLPISSCTPPLKAQSVSPASRHSVLADARLHHNDLCVSLVSTLPLSLVPSCLPSRHSLRCQCPLKHWRLDVAKRPLQTTRARDSRDPVIYVSVLQSVTLLQVTQRSLQPTTASVRPWHVQLQVARRKAQPHNVGVSRVEPFACHSYLVSLRMCSLGACRWIRFRKS